LRQSVTRGCHIELQAVFQALADPTRRQILDLLRTGATPVGRLAGQFPLSRPAIYKHLCVLQEAGLVTERKKGRERICELTPDPLRGVDDWLTHYRHFWTAHLERLKNYVEAGE
jgi:DNA-binding transcriptional ArsR family regulator